MSKLSRPAISVVMPVHNAAAYLPLSIKSITNQTFRDFEFIIIDDGSADKSWEVIKKYARVDKRIVAFRNPTNMKICKTLNRGIDMAKGKYIARMDADDWCYPDRLEKQYRFMESHPRVVISGGAMEVCDYQMRTLGVRNYGITNEQVRKNLFLYSPFCHATTIFRTDIARIQRYDEFLYDSEDYDLYFRLGLLGEFANLPDILYRMRINKSGVSLAHSRRQELLVLFIRLKAAVEYGYRMSLMDKIYFMTQLIGFFIVPHKVKFFIYNLIRNRWRSDFRPTKIAMMPLVPFWGPLSYFKVFLLNNAKKRK